jgi:Bifunctional DNA primase/polymerase, N-terminal
VLDIDRKHGINGFASLRDLAEANGASVQDFAATMAVATPSGGAHLYFRWDETVLRQKGVHNSSGLLGPGIDVRGIGGLVKAPGQDGYQVVPRDGIRSTAIVSAPEWLVHLARKPERKESADVQYEPGSAAAEREVDRIIDRLGNAAPGTRNRELNLAAYLLAKKGVMSENDAWEHIKTVMFTIGANDSVEAQQRAFASAWGSGVRDRNA